jgi:hypothetical protein
MQDPQGIGELDEATFVRALDSVAREGTIDVSGLHVSAEQLRQLLMAAPVDPERPGRRHLRMALFRQTTITGDAIFAGVTFAEETVFERAVLTGDVSFESALFMKHPDFAGVQIAGHALFARASFEAGGFFGAGARFAAGADFNGAHFGDDVDFEGAVFADEATFDGATFAAGAVFDATTFAEPTFFTETIFAGDTSFDSATFSEGASFYRTQFDNDALFTSTQFLGGGWFGEAIFANRDGHTNFDGATFHTADFTATLFANHTSFAQTTFIDTTDFVRARFSHSAVFADVVFSSDANLTGTRFEDARQFGPLLIFGALVLDDSVWADPVRMEVSARRISLERTSFKGGVDLFVRRAQLSLEYADLAAPSLVTELSAGRAGQSRLLGYEQELADGGWVCSLHTPSEAIRPSIASMRRAKVGLLTVSGMDLRACRFVGAHGLDGLRLERARFGRPPSRSRWSRRQTVAEEHQWRGHNGSPGWHESGPAVAPAWLGETSHLPDAEQIAGIYRALRKGREDTKDEPGAADFYYGEMEMRRHSSPSRSEHAIIWLYWLVAGYGLRASRAITALVITLVFLALLLHLWGFQPTQSYGRSVVFAAQSSISLLRAPVTQAHHETAGGQSIEIVLRLAGPLFFGLALLSLRGRIKR